MNYEINPSVIYFQGHSSVLRRRRAINCNIYVNQRDTQCFMIEFIRNAWWLDMFRTSVVHPQERLQAVCCGFGMW